MQSVRSLMLLSLSLIEHKEKLTSKRRVLLGDTRNIAVAMKMSLRVARVTMPYDRARIGPIDLAYEGD